MSNQELTTVAETPLAIKTLRDDLNKMSEQFKFALPAHIPVERFTRVVMTAVQNSPDLLKCTRQSFFNACVRAAQDGLLPDSREGAIVPYKSDNQMLAQWLPMIRGIRKQVRNAGVLSDWNVQVVQEGDQFDYELGDNPYIRHKPSPTGGRARKVLFAYSIATFPDGTKSREVMNADQINDIMKKSKAKFGPWSDPVFFPEMARKTVARLHSKQLPMSTDLDRLMHRDDELYDFAGAKRAQAAVQTGQRPASVTAALDAFGAGSAPEQASDAAQPSVAGEELGTAQHREEPVTSSSPNNPDMELHIAHARGRDAKTVGALRKALPPEYRAPDVQRLAQAWQRGWDGEAL